MKFISFLFLILFFVRGFFSYSQGCSDAGVCTVGSLSLLQFKYEVLPVEVNTVSKMIVEDVPISGVLKEDNNNALSEKEKTVDQTVKTANDSVQVKTPYAQSSSVDTSGSSAKTKAFHYFYKYPKYYFHFTTYYGTGDQGTTVITPQLEANLTLIKQKLFSQVKVPYTFVNGNLGSTSGISDLTISMSYLAFGKKKNNVVLTAGIKIPSNDANISNDSLPLPMVYQTSLGSTDVLAGAKFKYKKLDFTVGYQHAFNANENQYLHRTVSENPAYNNYFESKEMKRADDAVLRVNRNFQYKRASAAFGLLGIYHLQNDVIATITGTREEAKGSQGLTLNLNLAANLPVAKNIDATFIIARPVVTRDVRTDGLGRSLVAIAGIKYNIY